jgi:hypothetical protein
MDLPDATNAEQIELGVDADDRDVKNESLSGQSFDPTDRGAHR